MQNQVFANMHLVLWAFHQIFAMQMENFLSLNAMTSHYPLAHQIMLDLDLL